MEISGKSKNDFIIVGFRDGTTMMYTDEVTVLAETVKYITADSSKFQISPVTNGVIAIRKIKVSNKNKDLKVNIDIGDIDVKSLVNEAIRKSVKVSAIRRELK